MVWSYPAIRRLSAEDFVYESVGERAGTENDAHLTACVIPRGSSMTAMSLSFEMVETFELSVNVATLVMFGKRGREENVPDEATQRDPRPERLLNITADSGPDSYSAEASHVVAVLPPPTTFDGLH